MIFKNINFKIEHSLKTKIIIVRLFYSSNKILCTYRNDVFMYWKCQSAGTILAQFKMYFKTLTFKMRQKKEVVVETFCKFSVLKPHSGYSDRVIVNACEMFKVKYAICLSL